MCFTFIKAKAESMRSYIILVGNIHYIQHRIYKYISLIIMSLAVLAGWGATYYLVHWTENSSNRKF
jgi:hypothetical protein